MTKIPQTKLDDFRVLVRDLCAAEKAATADRFAVYRKAWRISGKIVADAITTDRDFGENRLGAEMRDALIALVEVGQKSDLICIEPSIWHVDQYEFDVSDASNTKRCMGLLSGRFKNDLNKSVSLVGDFAITTKKFRVEIWRYLLVAFNIGQKSSIEPSGIVSYVAAPFPDDQSEDASRKKAADSFYAAKTFTIRLDSQLSVRLMTAVLKRHGYHIEPTSRRRRKSLNVRISEQDYYTEIEPVYDAIANRLFPVFYKAIDTVVERLENEDKLTDEQLYEMVFEP